MKFWQLVAILDNDIDEIIQVAAASSEWKEYKTHYSNFSTLVGQQKRDVLDSLLDDKFVRAVLEKTKRFVYLSSDNWLRSSPATAEDIQISFVSAYEKYNGKVLEDVREFGQVRV